MADQFESKVVEFYDGDAEGWWNVGKRLTALGIIISVFGVVVVFVLETCLPATIESRYEFYGFYIAAGFAFFIIGIHLVGVVIYRHLQLLRKYVKHLEDKVAELTNEKQ
ncbi:MAG: hypothetical protein NUW37_07720 [Planctomycetes bacterium]|nr:hypothetical protein [Planctomycetota bacterium]